MDNPDEGNDDSPTAHADDTQQQPPPLPDEFLEMDTEFAVLSHPRRRYLLYTLDEKNQWTLRELATKLAAWELDIPEESVTPDQRNQVYVSLMHAHVPYLVDHGVVNFNRDSGMLTKAEHADSILKKLAGMGGSTDRDQQSHAERDYHG